MPQDNKTIAGREEVIERAVKKLKEEHGLYLTKKEMDDVYEQTYRYIKKKLDKEPYLSIWLRGLGKAYWTQYYCAKRKRRSMYSANPNEEKVKLWKHREDEIEEYYQNNQVGKNAGWQHKLFHVFPPLLKSSSRRGYTIEDIEEKQNKIE